MGDAALWKATTEKFVGPMGLKRREGGGNEMDTLEGWMGV